MSASIWSNYKDKGYFTKEQLDNHKDFYKTLFTKLEINTQDKTAIEIGAGHGIYTEVFVDLFKRYSAIEPDTTLFDDLKLLVTTKYSDKSIKLLNSTCENLLIDGQSSFMIFTHSFQFTDFEQCKHIIDRILKINGYLLILLPFIPCRLDDNFKKNNNWRSQIMRTIAFLIGMEGYTLLYMINLKKSYVLLFQKNG